MKRVLLVSNRVMHYRVSVYNHFWRRFAERGWDFSVLTNNIQEQNRNRVLFDVQEVPFDFLEYRRRIARLSPDAVIVFLHLKDLIQWPLIHWLKIVGIPFASWTKTRNLDDPDNAIRNAMFSYVNRMSDALILYTDDLKRFVPSSQHHKIFVANNTINFNDFPQISQSKQEIKREFDIPFEKVVLFVGRIGEEQNRKKVDHLIDIFRDLTIDGAGLVIVGSGLTDALRARINPKNTRYMGEVHDPRNETISKMFLMSDVCSIPGHVGLGLNQAFYFGLPVVTEAGKQPPEITYLQHGRNGFVVDEDDTAALKERLVFLLQNEAERQRMGANARHDILERASVDGMFDGFLACAQHLAGKGME